MIKARPDGPAFLPSPKDRAGPAPDRSFPPVGGIHCAHVIVAAIGRTAIPDTFALGYRDEEIVLRSRAGELPHDIARALGHDLVDVMRALNRAIVLGIPITPDHAAPADRRDLLKGEPCPST